MTRPPPAAPQIKICGLTRPQDARLAAALGADLLGLNFYRHSPRRVGIEEARRIADVVAGEVKLVGVFVDHRCEEVEAVAEAVGLDLLQFHGDQTPGEISRFAARAIKVFRLERGASGSFDPGGLAAYPEVWGFLFDCPAAGLHGGTGHPWAYETMAKLPRRRPLLVAGGLGPANVRRALRDSGATGVDVCSGVESAPGIKDPELLRRFVEEVQHGTD